MTTDPEDLSDELVAYYRGVLEGHTCAPESGVCPVCNVVRCPDWLNAYDRLAAAGQVMTESPTPWEPFRPRPKR